MNLCSPIAQYIHWRPHLDTLFRALQTSEIPFLILKGWAFIPDLYPDPTVGRPMGDIDLLVQPHKFPDAVQLLTDLGYTQGANKPRTKYDPNSSPLPYELDFYNATGVSIDLHRHIFPTYWSTSAFSIDMDAVWKSRQPFTDWSGNTLERLSPELNFLHLIMHITIHGMPDAQQKSYADLMRLVKKYETALDWERIHQLACQWELRTALIFVSSFCQRKFQFSLPGIRTDDRQPGKMRVWLVEKVLTPRWERNPGQDHWLLRAMLNLAVVEKPEKVILLTWSVFFPTADQRYHLHGFPVSLAGHYLRLLKKGLGNKPANLIDGKTVGQIRNL